MSHCGEVTTEGFGTVELTDEEVAKLVEIMRNCGSADLEVLNLKVACPEIYEKIAEAYRETAYHAEYTHWLREGYDEGCYEYDQEELISYCEEECGFLFDEDPEDFKDADGEFDEEAYEERKYEVFFDEWLDDYLDSLDDEEYEDFLCNDMNAEVDMSDWTGDYTISIPYKIVEMAGLAEEE
jgi:hypothetical protein